MKESVDFAKALSDQNRMKILRLLAERDMCVCEMIDVLKAPQTRVSKHLQRLRTEGLVKDRREGKWVVYSLNKRLFNKKMNKLKDFFSGGLEKEASMKAEFKRLNSLEKRELLCKRLKG